MESFMIRVVLVDDHPGMLVGIEHSLSNVMGIKVVGIAHSSTELMALLDTTAYDVVVSDYMMPDERFGDGLSLFGLLSRRYPGIRLVVLTMLDSPSAVRGMLEFGISCLVSKSDAIAHIVPAIHAAFTGGRYVSPTISQVTQELQAHRASLTTALSQREIEVVRLYASGMTINQIAEQLKRSKKTISTHKTNAMAKLGFKSDTELLLYARDQGFVAGARPSEIR
jgi:two-component system capsular synthesis response regulator RcsB